MSTGAHELKHTGSESMDSAEALPPKFEGAGSAPRVRTRWIIALVCAMIGVGAGWFGPLQILLPAQAQRIADLLGSGTSKEALLALVTGIGALVSTVANPLWGVLSDVLRPRLGRAPVLIVGVAVGIAGLLVLSVVLSPVGMVIGWLLVQIGLNGPLAALAAMMADNVPESQRGLVGSWFGIAQTIGLVLGTAVAVLCGEGQIGYVAIAIAVPLLLIAIVLANRSPYEGGGQAVVRQATADLAEETRSIKGISIVGLRPTKAFVGVWTMRILMNMVNALIMLYLYYYLHDGIKLEPEQVGNWVLIVTVVAATVTVVAAAIGGVLSDRLGRRRIFCGSSAVLLIVAAVTLALQPPLWIVLVGCIVFGIGQGLYLAVDLAMLTAVLPDESTKATMLGIGNIAAALPQVLAPAIAAPLVLQGGYPLLYGVTAVLSVAALILTPFLKVR